jgi:hypothetical protein
VVQDPQIMFLQAAAAAAAATMVVVEEHLPKTMGRDGQLVVVEVRLTWEVLWGGQLPKALELGTDKLQLLGTLTFKVVLLR